MIYITVAIPVYNVEKYVERSVLSALNQNFSKAYEILIVDDCSTDGSMNIVQHLCHAHPKGNIIRIIKHDSNKGLAVTRNTAIESAKGEFIYFMDSDDIITADCLKKLHRESQNADCISGSYVKCNENGSLLSRFNYGDFKKTKTCNSLLKHIYCQNGPNDIMMWNKLYRLSFLREYNIKCPDSGNIDDIFFTTQVVFFCKRFVTLSDVTYHYNINGSSLTGGMGDLKYDYAEQLLKIYALVLTFVKTYDGGELQWAMECFYLGNIFWMLNKLRDSSMDSVQRETIFINSISQLHDFTSTTKYNKDLSRRIFDIKDSRDINYITHSPIFNQKSVAVKCDVESKLWLKAWRLKLRLYRKWDTLMR